MMSRRVFIPRRASVIVSSTRTPGLGDALRCFFDAAVSPAASESYAAESLLARFREFRVPVSR
jgi:hypothetical protein